MDFVLANRVEDVLRAAFDDEFPGMAQGTSSKLWQLPDGCKAVLYLVQIECDSTEL